MSALSFDIRPPSGVDIRALRLRLNGDLVLPGDPDWDEARQAWNLAVDQRPAAVALAESRRGRRRAVVDVRARARAARRAAGHRPQRRAARRPRATRSCSRPRAMRGVEIDADARTRPRRGRRALGWTSSTPPPSTASPRCTARRPTSASSATRSAAASAGSPASYGLAANSVTAVELVTADGGLVRADADARARPVLGPARRRRQLRRRDRDRVRAATRSPRSTPACCSSRSSAPARCCTPGASGPTTVPGRGHLGRPHAAGPADPGDPRAAARQQRSWSSRRCSSATEAEGADAARAAARARAGDGHVRDASRRRRSQHLHMDPPQPGPGRRRRRCSRRAAVRGDRRDRRDRSCPPLLFVEIRHARRRARPPLARATVPSARSTPASRCSRSASPMTPEMGAAVERGRRPCRARHSRRWESGRTYFNFSERPVDARAALPDRDVHAGCAASRPSTTRRAVRRQPPDPAGTLAVSGAAAPRVRRSRPASLVNVARRVPPCATSGRRREAHRDARAGRLHPRAPARSGSVRASARPAVRA